jgi:RNA polymerase subunit RPABC4/transcription elongation factor Spt4
VIETAARGAQFLLAIGIAYLIAVWFALVAWTFRDIEARSRSVFTQVFSTLLVVLFFIPGLLLYLILRPKETLDQAFQRALEEEYLLQDLDDAPVCLGCQRAVDPDFVLCPHCHTRLREPCPSCERLVDVRWSLCPYCASSIDRRLTPLDGTGDDTVPMLNESQKSRRERARVAAARRVGIPPEELDAAADAMLGSEGRAAVTAGTPLESNSNAQSQATGPFAAVRARFSQLGDSPFERPKFEGNGSNSESEGSAPPESRFWADPLPGTERSSPDTRNRP